ncbi:MAG: tRNA pseudouridine(38-40) synthase TruA [bacterium]
MPFKTQRSRNIKLTLEYDGTGYHGWQIQPDLPTVSGVLEIALEGLIGSKTRVIGASRTDAGAHALGQIANFKTEHPSIPTDKFPRALNSLLPKDVVVTGSEEVPPDFHARFSAVDRTYQYLILNRPFPSALQKRYSHWVPQPLNPEQMREVARFLIGRHDFTSFSSSDKDLNNPYRRIKELRITDSGWQTAGTTSRLESQGCPYSPGGFPLFQADGLIRIHIRADAFLPNMIRAIVGTLIEVGQGKRSTYEVEDILAARDRTLAGPTVPACGLYLIKVDYV